MFNNRSLWRRSSRCAAGDCVEVRLGATVEVRDSKLGEASPVLEFTTAEWAAFLAGAKAGEFDIAEPASQSA